MFSTKSLHKKRKCSRIIVWRYDKGSSWARRRQGEEDVMEEVDEESKAREAKVVVGRRKRTIEDGVEVENVLER